MPRLALCSTIIRADSSFSDWCNHHLALFDYIILWVDDPKELDSIYIPSSHRLIVNLGCQKNSHSVHGRSMIRQDINTNKAIVQARELGCEWLCHLDADELLHAGSRTELEQLLTPERGQVRFVNHEVCAKWEAANPFKECNLFKVNGSYPFNLYSNGKAIARMSALLMARGAHAFKDYEGISIVNDSAVVLHYACATYKLWLDKYVHLGNFPDLWWDELGKPITLGFHLESRDIIKACMTRNNFDDAEAFFRARIIDKANCEDNLKNGSLGFFAPLAS